MKMRTIGTAVPNVITVRPSVLTEDRSACPAWAEGIRCSTKVMRTTSTKMEPGR